MTRALNLVTLLSDGQPLSGEKLAARLGVSRQALHKQILRLRKQGYAITGKPKEGYQLTSQPDLLTPERLLPHLKTARMGRTVVHLDLTDSTQTRCRALAEQGTPEGTLVVAERQIRGRGRMGRAWSSETGGIWASLLLRPKLPPHHAPLLSLTAGLAIAEAVERVCKVRCGVKWPNDIMVSRGPGKWRKVCGILTETAAEADRLHWAVVGFGIDANNRLPPGLKDIAVNLKEASGKPVDRARLLCAVLEQFEKQYGRFLKEGFAALKGTYWRKCVLKDKTVRLADAGETEEGLCVGIEADGALKLKLRDGTLRRFHAGDTTLHR